MVKYRPASYMEENTHPQHDWDEEIDLTQYPALIDPWELARPEREAQERRLRAEYEAQARQATSYLNQTFQPPRGPRSYDPGNADQNPYHNPWSTLATAQSSRNVRDSPGPAPIVSERPLPRARPSRGPNHSNPFKGTYTEAPRNPRPIQHQSSNTTIASQYTIGSTHSQARLFQPPSTSTQSSKTSSGRPQGSRDLEAQSQGRTPWRPRLSFNVPAKMRNWRDRFCCGADKLTLWVVGFVVLLTIVCCMAVAIIAVNSVKKTQTAMGSALAGTILA